MRKSWKSIPQDLWVILQDIFYYSLWAALWLMQTSGFFWTGVVIVVLWLGAEALTNVMLFLLVVASVLLQWLICSWL